MKSPFSYFGGKQILAKEIIRYFPKHITYIEPFFGSGAVLFQKEPSKLEVCNDLNKNVINFYRVIQDRELFAQFKEGIELTISHRALYKEYQEDLKIPIKFIPDLKRAVKWYYCQKFSFSGSVLNSWSYDVKGHRNTQKIDTYWSSIEYLPEIHNRLKTIQFECQDFRKILSVYDFDQALFYLDPPYIHDTRSGKNDYENEMSNQDHKELIEIILKLKGNIILSGYRHPIYEQLENKGWIRKDFDVRLDASMAKGNKRNRRIDSIWINPRCYDNKNQLELFEKEM